MRIKLTGYEVKDALELYLKTKLKTEINLTDKISGIHIQPYNDKGAKIKRCDFDIDDDDSLEFWVDL